MTGIHSRPKSRLTRASWPRARLEWHTDVASLALAALYENTMAGTKAQNLRLETWCGRFECPSIEGPRGHSFLGCSVPGLSILAVCVHLDIIILG